MVIMFGGLHIEMAAFKIVGDLLKDSGWSGALAEAEKLLQEQQIHLSLLHI